MTKLAHPINIYIEIWYLVLYVSNPDQTLALMQTNPGDLDANRYGVILLWRCIGE